MVNKYPCICYLRIKQSYFDLTLPNTSFNKINKLSFPESRASFDTQFFSVFSAALLIFFLGELKAMRNYSKKLNGTSLNKFQISSSPNSNNLILLPKPKIFSACLPISIHLSYFLCPSYYQQ